MANNLTGLSSIPDETWEALRKDKLRREKKIKRTKERWKQKKLKQYH